MSQVGSERQRETVRPGDCGLGDWLQAVPPLHSTTLLSSAQLRLPWLVINNMRACCQEVQTKTKFK